MTLKNGTAVLLWCQLFVSSDIKMQIHHYHEHQNVNLVDNFYMFENFEMKIKNWHGVINTTIDIEANAPFWIVDVFSLKIHWPRWYFNECQSIDDDDDDEKSFYSLVNVLEHTTLKNSNSSLMLWWWYIVHV